MSFCPRVRLQTAWTRSSMSLTRSVLPAAVRKTGYDITLQGTHPLWHGPTAMCLLIPLVYHTSVQELRAVK